jgi:hypothetical protein
MVIGTISAYAAIARFPWNIAIQVARGRMLDLGAVRQRVAAPAEHALGGASLQHCHAAIAAGLAYPVLHEP